MIIIHKTPSPPAAIRRGRKDWVVFDEEDKDKDSSSLKVSQTDSHLNLSVDMRAFDVVELSLVSKVVGRKGGSVRKWYGSEGLVRNGGLLATSGFYYSRGEYDGEVCSRLLSSTAPGTFLIRDSSDPNYLYTLSLQTERGPTSVRLVYAEGSFRLDAADSRLLGVLPSFPTVLHLVQYYAEVNKKISSSGSASGRQVWIDSQTGRTHSPVKLVKPLRHSVPSLKHLSRLTLNATLNDLSCDNLKKVPSSVIKYLNSYEFTL